MLPHKQYCWQGKWQQARIASAEILSEYKKNTLHHESIEVLEKVSQRKGEFYLVRNVQDLSYHGPDYPI